MKRVLAVQVVVALVAAGQVRPIREVRQNNSSGEPLLNGQVVAVTGVVSEAGHFGGYGPAYVQDATGGVAVYGAGVAGLRIGDSVTVTGTVELFNGLTEISNNPGVTKHSAVTPVEPRTFTIAEVGSIDTAAGYVENEAWLARFDSVTIRHFPGQVFKGDSNYVMYDTLGDSITVRIDRDAAEIVGMTIPDGRLVVTGVIGQYQRAAPYFGGYQILPRVAADIGIRVRPLLTIADVQRTGPDGVTPLLKDSVVRVRGRVTGPARVFSSSTTNRSLFIQDSTQGINLYGCSYNSGEAAFLDSLGIEWEVEGTVTEYNGLTEIASGRMFVTDRNAVPVTPRTLPFNFGLSERHESSLWLLVGDVVQAPVRSGSGFNVLVKNGSSTVTIRVGDNANIDLSWVIVGRRIRFTGIGGQYDYSDPYTTGYQLMPRSSGDLYDTTGAFEPSARLRVDTIVPNPFAAGLGQFVTIQVNAPSSYRLTVAIYDLEGRLVKELVDNAPGGYYDLKWNGTDRQERRLPAGTYLLNVKGSTGGGQTETLTRPIALAVKLN